MRPTVCATCGALIADGQAHHRYHRSEEIAARLSASYIMILTAEPGSVHFTTGLQMMQTAIREATDLGLDVDTTLADTLSGLIAHSQDRR